MVQVGLQEISGLLDPALYKSWWRGKAELVVFKEPVSGITPHPKLPQVTLPSST